MKQNYKFFKITATVVALFLLGQFSAQAQSGNYVFAGTEAVNFGSVSLSPTGGGSPTWATDRTATPGYFGISGTATFTNAADASTALINGYVKHYVTAPNQGAVFPVGTSTGNDLRSLTTSGTIANNSIIATAWILGDPTGNLDPTSTGAAGGAHPITAVGTGITQVSNIGQWDWQDLTATAAGATVTVSLPDVSAFSNATSLRLAGWNGTQWINLSGTTGASGTTENSTLSGTITSGISALAIGKGNTDVFVDIKIFLQGAYSAGSMTTTLRTNNLIPLTQPYSAAPFSYAGTEAVASIPAGVTDWVLVELRNAVTPATIVATRAAFVKSDGSVVDLDGTSVVSFANKIPVVPSGNYFVAIKHRNHLAIRTAAALPLSSITTRYDFTTGQNQAYQNPAVTLNAAQKDLGGGVFAMWGGNANSNLNVRYTGLANDLTTLLSTLGGTQSTVLTNVYNAADMNLNGVVRYTGLNNDNSFLLSILGGTQSSVITQH